MIKCTYIWCNTYTHVYNYTVYTYVSYKLAYILTIKFKSTLYYLP